MTNAYLSEAMQKWYVILNLDLELKKLYKTAE